MLSDYFKKQNEYDCQNVFNNFFMVLVYNFSGVNSIQMYNYHTKYYSTVKECSVIKAVT